MADGARPAATESGDFAALIHNGIAARAAGDLDLAIARFRAACAARPAELGARCELAFTLLAAGDDDGAAALAGEVLAQAPDNFSALTTLASIDRRQGRLEAAQARLGRAWQVAPERAEVALDRIALLEALGRPREALAATFELLAHDPDHPERLLRMARLQRTAGSAAAAAVFAALAARRAGEAPHLRVEAARVLAELGRRREAEQALRAALLAQPAFGPAYGALAGLQSEAGQARQADLTLEAGLEAAPHEPGLWAAAADRRAARGDEAGALDAWSRLLALQPDHPEALRAKAAAARRSGRLPEAIALLGRLAPDAPDAREALLELAREARAAGDPAGALGALEDFLSLRAVDPHRSALEAASEHLALGEPAPARALLEAAAAGRGPLAVDAAVRLAALDRLAGAPHAAVERLDALRAEGVAGVDIDLEQARSLADLGRFEGALGRLGADLSPPVLAMRLELAARLGDGDAVDAAAQEAAPACAGDLALWAARAEALIAIHGSEAADRLGPAPTPGDRWARGRLHRVQARLAWARWRLQEAHDACEAALQAFPEELEAQETLARLAILQARPEAAHAWLARFLRQDRAGRVMRGEPLAPTQTLHGQLINELRLDPGLQAHLAQLAVLEPEPREEALREVLHERPDCTPAALQRLLALRQAGHLLAREAPSQAIPHQLVQVWLGEEPPAPVARAMALWRSANPGFAVRVFDRAGAEHFLARSVGEAALQAWRVAEGERAERLFQWVWLSREGGWFADARLAPRGGLGRLGAGAGLVAVQGAFAELDADLVGAVPGHPALLTAADQAIASILRGDSDIPWLGLGPGLLSRAAAAATPDDLACLEPHQALAVCRRLPRSRV